MRLAWLWCSCVLLVTIVACDRAPTQPVAPSGPTPSAVIDEPIREAPAARIEVEPIVDAPTPAPDPEPVDEQTMQEPTATEISESSESIGECCRTCRKGKACGDTCVARDRECTVAPGCACDA